MNNFLVSSITENDNNFLKNFFVLSKFLEGYSLKVKNFNPIYSNINDIKGIKDKFLLKSVEYELAFDLLSLDKKNDLLELITENFYSDNNNLYDLSLIYGRYAYNKLFLDINNDICCTLNASQIILLNVDLLDEEISCKILYTNYIYNLSKGINIVGFIITDYNFEIFDIDLFLEKLKLLCERYNNKLIDFIGYISTSFAADINIKKIRYFDNKIKDNISPIFFRYKLMQLAKKSLKTIVLPEGEEIRTIKAAIFCETKKIAHIILLGRKDKVLKIIDDNKLILPESIDIINPDDISERYIKKLYELRKHKGISLEDARESLKNNIVLGTMMLHESEVDGLVSGAMHTTADTILPALRIIKLSSYSTIVSSIFFMLMPNKVILFADCAVNTNPTACELSEIAISSAKTAKAFGINPKVAMISYSTKDSGSGKDVDFIKEVISLIKDKDPNLLLDGPLQYDSAYVRSVGKQKAPKSKVAGDANVFIFPNLNTGNAVYKAVQRSANITSIGPILQGLKKPVNDLSRGSMVDDIIYTIAVTAIQSNIIK